MKTTRSIDGLFLDDANATYDATAKKFLARRIFLARILKRCVAEFAPFSVQDIAEKYIDGQPEIGIVPVTPDRTNAIVKITGANTEYKTLTEGETAFDIRFTAHIPTSGDRIKLIVNIEAQKKCNPGYSLLKRGIFYGSRLISSQYNVEFTEPNFDGIKKVVSIWVCMSSPNGIGNGITEYYMTERPLVGNIIHLEQEYDLMQVVMIYLGRDIAKTDDELLRLLHLIFRAQINAEEKKMRLKDEFDIEMDNAMLKEMNIMCNLSEGIAEKARETTLLDNLRNLTETLKLTPQAAMDALKIPLDMQSDLLAKL